MNLNGNADKIRARAKKATLCNGAVDVWYLPYDPMIQGVTFRRWSNMLEEHEFDKYMKVFIMLDCAIVDAQLLDESNEEAAGIAEYINGRGVVGSMENFDLFALLLSDDIVNVQLWPGYNDTRAQLPEAPEETRQPKPDEDSPLEKRGKKSTEPTT